MSPIVCVTVDFDGHALWLQWDPALSPTRLGRADFAGTVGLPRMLDMFAAEDVHATIYVPGHTVEVFPEVCRRALAEGHEIGHHGYLHKDHTRLSVDDERREFVRGLEAYDRLLGIVPRGFRAPGGDLSVNSIPLALEHGLSYDASGVAHDCLPYYARVGDAWEPDGPLTLGRLVDVVEIPLLGSMIDVPQMEFLTQPPMPGLHAYSKILRMWCDEFDWLAESEPSGVLSLVLHPSTIPRGARLRVLRDFLRYTKAGGARFLRHGEVADAFRISYPFDGRG